MKATLLKKQFIKSWFHEIISRCSTLWHSNFYEPLVEKKKKKKKWNKQWFHESFLDKIIRSSKSNASAFSRNFCSIPTPMQSFSVQWINFKNSFSGWAPGLISNVLDLFHGIKLIFHLSSGMAIQGTNFHPVWTLASPEGPELLFILEAHIKKRFSKIVIKHAKQSLKLLAAV